VFGVTFNCAPRIASTNFSSTHSIRALQIVWLWMGRKHTFRPLAIVRLRHCTLLVYLPVAGVRGFWNPVDLHTLTPPLYTPDNF
jgi:hypothetical protein